MASSPSTTPQSLKTTVTLGGEDYMVEMSMPAEAPTTTTPYYFKVYNEGTSDTGTPASDDLLLGFAFGGTDNAALEFSTPSTFLPTGGTFSIKDLSVSFFSGAFNSTTDNPFTSGSAGGGAGGAGGGAGGTGKDGTGNDDKSSK